MLIDGVDSASPESTPSIDNMYDNIVTSSNTTLPFVMAAVLFLLNFEVGELTP